MDWLCTLGCGIGAPHFEPVGSERAEIGALAELEEVRKKEASMDAAVRGGMKIPDWVQGALKSKPVRWLD